MSAFTLDEKIAYATDKLAAARAAQARESALVDDAEVEVGVPVDVELGRLDLGAVLSHVDSDLSSLVTDGLECVVLDASQVVDGAVFFAVDGQHESVVVHARTLLAVTA